MTAQPDHHSTAHDTMRLERSYSAPVERVFAAWATADAKRIWFLGRETDEDGSEYRLDFRVGGSEYSRGGAPDGDVYTYIAEYHDIVDGARIVYSNHMLRGDDPISASITSVEFIPEAEGTRLVLTEHGIYLDDRDRPEYRTQGIGAQLDALARVLSAEPAAR